MRLVSALYTILVLPPVVLAKEFHFHLLSLILPSLSSFPTHSVSLQSLPPLFFFSGQILNRFTKDLGQIDEMLPITVFDVVVVSILKSMRLLLVPTNVSLYITINL